MALIDFPVDVREIDLSLRGWEVLEARVRISETQFDNYGDSFWEYAVAYSVKARRDESNFDTDSMSYLQTDFDLLLEVLGPDQNSQLVKLEQQDAPRWTSRGDILWRSRNKLDPEKEFQFILTAVDVTSAKYYLCQIPRKQEYIPVEIVDSSNREFATVEFERAEAYFSSGLYERQVDLDFRGRTKIAGVEEFKKIVRGIERFKDYSEDELSFADILTPSVIVEVQDNSGFPLYEVDLEVEARCCLENGNLSHNSFRWVGRDFEDAERLMGDPARVLVRVEDDTF